MNKKKVLKGVLLTTGAILMILGIGAIINPEVFVGLGKIPGVIFFALGFLPFRIYYKHLFTTKS